jgi:hypothetical protein
MSYWEFIELEELFLDNYLEALHRDDDVLVQLDSWKLFLIWNMLYDQNRDMEENIEVVFK